MTKNKEKAEVHNVFFASVFKRKTHCSPGTQPLELKDRSRDQNEASILPGEVFSDILHNLKTHKSVGTNGIHPRVVRELAEMFTKCFQAFTISSGSLGMSQLTAVLQI